MKSRDIDEHQTRLTLNFNEDSKLRDDEPGRFEAALLLSAAGDALGWPSETLGIETKKKLSFKLPISNYVKWSKKVGGYWWGYYDYIEPGEYSDDTQLTLAVARSIDASGRFAAERFAYLELPLWLQYERGGGRSVKTAARYILRNRSGSQYTFYKTKFLDYRMTGANGAAMRNLPIALANMRNIIHTVEDSFLNAIITHGHPRAIIGAILYALGLHSAYLSNGELYPERFTSELIDTLNQIPKILQSNRQFKSWERKWNTQSATTSEMFNRQFTSAILETTILLNEIPNYLTRPVKEFYQLAGALSAETRGSGSATVGVALYLYLKFLREVKEGLQVAASMLGSDTDTIASFLGGLLGITYGLPVIPAELLEQLQDREYLRNTGRQLFYTAFGDQFINAMPLEHKVEKKQANESILSWEIGLHEMFWDAISEGNYISHPTLGRGKVIRKEIKGMLRGGYEVRLVKVKFDTGQSCIFHSRIKDNRKLEISFADDLQYFVDSENQKGRL